MGKRGPRPEPTALKRLKGNPGKRRLSGEAAVRGGAPAMPRWLRKRGKEAWKKLVPVLEKAGLATRADGWSLGVLCYLWQEWHEARLVAGRSGRLATTPNGFTQLSAEHVVERQLRLDLLRVAALFGLSPSDRAGLKVAEDGGANALQAWLLGRLEAQKAAAAARGFVAMGQGETGKDGEKDGENQSGEAGGTPAVRKAGRPRKRRVDRVDQVEAGGHRPRLSGGASDKPGRPPVGGDAVVPPKRRKKRDS